MEVYREVLPRKMSHFCGHCGAGTQPLFVVFGFPPESHQSHFLVLTLTRSWLRNGIRLSQHHQTYHLNQLASYPSYIKRFGCSSFFERLAISLQYFLVKTFSKYTLFCQLYLFNEKWYFTLQLFLPYIPMLLTLLTYSNEGQLMVLHPPARVINFSPLNFWD